MVMTTVVMIAGFVTVLTSQLPTHQSFAALSCITLGAALLADLIILPALLLCFFARSPIRFSEDKRTRDHLCGPTLAGVNQEMNSDGEDRVIGYRG